MLHPSKRLDGITMYELAKEHHTQLLKEAEQWRLVEQLQAERPDLSSLTERVVDGLSTLLIDAGQWLKERQAPSDGKALG